MKTVLVYPPFAWPSAPPLGIALLKSYVQSVLPTANISCMDLNLAFFSKPGHAAKTPCRICPRRGRGECIPPAAYFEDGLYDRTADFFRSDGNSFYNPKKHARHYFFLRSFMEQARMCHEALLKGYVEGRLENEGPVERLVSPSGTRILDGHPGIVGFSTQSDQAVWALALSKWLKKNSRVTTVIGGYFPSFCGAEEIVRAFPFVDYAVKGEGEKPLAGLIDRLMNNRDRSVPGLVYKRNRVYSSAQAPEHNLNGMPLPDFSDFRLENYFSPHPVLPLLASRGCPWGKCAFCAHHENYGKKYRERTAEDVAREIEHQVKTTGAKHFLFCDEHIGSRRLMELSKAAAPLGITFGLAGLKPEKAITRKILASARHAGCSWAYIGAESFSQRILGLIRKGTRAKETIRVIRDCTEVGIIPFVSYMWGFPTQTRAEIEAETAVINEESPLISLPDDGHPFTLEKGSAVSENPEAFKVAGMEPVPMFETAGGNTVFSGKFRFVPNEGLTPFQAQAAYRPGPEIYWETHSFWESLILLSDRGVKLSFDRDEFLTRILAPPEILIATALRKSGESDATTILSIALCQYKTGKYGLAKKTFSRLLEMKIPKTFRFSAMYHLGLMEEETVKHDAAKYFFKKAARLAETPSDKAGALFHIALCLEKAGALETAVINYRELLQEFPGETFEIRTLSALGSCLLRLGDYDNAIDVLNEAAAADMEGKHAVTINFHLAGAYEKTGRLAAMRKAEKKLSELL